MSRRNVIGMWAVLVALGLVLAAGPGARGEGWDRADGALNKVQGPIGKVVTLVLEEGKVKWDRGAWEEDEKKEAKEGDVPVGVGGGMGGNVGVVGGPAGGAGAKARVGGMGPKPTDKLWMKAVQVAQAMGLQMQMGGGGLNYREMRHSSAKGWLRLEIIGEAVALQLQESGDGGRRLEVEDDGAGSLRVMVTGDRGEMVILQQAGKGAVSAVALGGGKVQARTAESWVALYRQDPAWMEKEVLGALRTLGVRPVLSPRDALVKAMVMGSLGAGDDAVGKKLLEDLDSEDFATREKASQVLKDEYTKYRGLIVERAKAPGNVPETVARLAAITAAHLDDNRVSAVVGAFDLTKDAAYLVALLSEAKGRERAAVVSQLEKVTGQKFGDDEGAWRKWVEKK